MLVLLCFSLFGQNTKSRAEFFKEFYGTLINNGGLEIPEYKPEEAPTVDLKDVIKQLESRYNIDIPAEEEAKFKTVEEVAEYVNLFLQQQAQEVEPVVDKPVPADKPIIDPVKPVKKKKKYSWTTKYYGAFGVNEPLGVQGGSDGTTRWNGNFLGWGAFDLKSNMLTWEAGMYFHPYGRSGRIAQRPNSFGFVYSFSSFDYLGTHADSLVGYSANDTTATHWSISFVMRQNILGKNVDRPKFTMYMEESVRLGSYSYKNVNADIHGDKLFSIGIGLAQGIEFLIFDLKLYELLDYIPNVPSTGIMDKIALEVGLRLGIALKF